MRGFAGGLEKLSAGVSGLVKKTLDCTVHDIVISIYINCVSIKLDENYVVALAV